MNKLLWAVFAVVVLAAGSARGQSGNSNIGTEFWTCWMDHITGPPTSQMNLYIACDVATTVTVASADGSFSTTVSVVPNVIKKFPVPNSAFLGNTNGLQNKGLHITSKNPIAVYAHIYASAVSGATLLLPVNTLSNDYYSLNYTQLSNASPSYSLFTVIGTEDNTTVNITPTAALIGGQAANQTFTITLAKGQVYQGISNTDLTGTRITSVINGASGCKKIAVFSGSNKIYIGKPNMTSDNLFQQVYPTTSWGKNYITVPLKDRNYDIIRIVLSDPTAQVTLNGTLLTAAQFTKGFYYDFNSQATNYISSDKPIQVIQYAVTQGNGITGVGTIASDVGDPEMIFLNPLEQTIDHVILYSATEYLITKSYINVVLPTAATSSFLFDGATSSTGFTAVPGNTAYSYKQLAVTSGATHTLSASQGFNAIAYGFGNAESYGYAAGTNVKNLNEYVQYNNPVTNQVATSGCTGTALNPQVVLPYPTTSITWDLGNGTTPVVQTNPQPKSTFYKNGVLLYVYDYGSSVTYTAGGYSIKVTVFNPVITLCGSNEEVDLNFNVADPPQAKFSSRDTLCVTDTIGFKDQSSGNGSAIQSWKWTFGNGDTSIVQNPVYKYLTPGDYTVGLTVTIPTGCQSLYTKTVHVRAASVAAFNSSTPDCETQGVTFTDKSNPGEGKIVKWIWNYGDGSATDNRTDNLPFVHTYATAGTYSVKLQILTDKSCFSTTITKTIVVHPHPVVSFTLPDVCLANATVQFTDKSIIADSTMSQFKYLWDFGDATAATVANPNTATTKSPTHQFTKAGTYHVSLTVISKDTCSVTLSKDFTISGQANFTAPASACPADTVLFTDKTDGSNTVVSSWHWSFGDGAESVLQNPKHPFATPGDYTVVLTVTGHNGCSTTSYSQNIHINQKPQADFSYVLPACETKSVSFTDISVPKEGFITDWKWNFGDGTTANIQNPTHIFNPSNTYTVTLTVTTNLGCISTPAIKQITVYPQPKASFILPDVCFQDGAATFKAVPDSRVISYVWTFGDLTSSTTTTATGATVTHAVSSSGTYYAKLTVTTANGCLSDTTQQYHVNGSTPVADFALSAGGKDLCSSNEVIFVNKATIPGLNDLVTKIEMYYDYPNNNTPQVYSRPVYGQLLRHTYPLEITSPHTYTVRMVAYSGATCIGQAKDVSVTVLPVPQATFTGMPSAVCQNASVVNLLAYTTLSGNGTAKFYMDGTFLPTSKIDPSTAGLGQHRISLIYTSNTSSCADTIPDQIITVAPIPTVSAGQDQDVLAGESVTLNGTASGSNISVLWTPSTGLSNPTILNPVATPQADTRYKLTVTLTSGGISCPVSDSVMVRLLRLPIIPNTFTPNGDGFNDTWEIKYLDRYDKCTVKVFNRSGALVYSSNGYAVPWDGTYKNTPLPVGTYFYIISPGHNLAIMSGSVNLIK
ncbi:gliding motility-associated-like protein [Mucilaginibacter gracilis]|uniref:Gliding motility-associated-like protein n=1 Tax=Mucilaginibacter gracilis TaxID=423350 RepID=A0A495J1U7_9SPHI|nr:PKD domain-containing protein [Mucilaginibacter gracilis]RKR82956.1 gliding motility-associated-like protein [Mucilaginibacter gracilis]